MKLFASFLLLVAPALAATPRQPSISGTWEGTANVHGQQVPVVLQITGGIGSLQAALLNGPESSCERSHCSRRVGRRDWRHSQITASQACQTIVANRSQQLDTGTGTE